MTILNLTPHDIKIRKADLSMVTFPKSGDVARVSMETTPVDMIDGINVDVTNPGPVVGLPAPVDGTIFIVSAMVRSAVPNRKDVFSPGPLVRDVSGNPIAADGLVSN
jgi:hypothetical protein